MSDPEDVSMSDSESDVSMSDAESESLEPHTIFIPDPPTLPALFKDDRGVVHAATWRHAQHFVAKYNKHGTGFDVRQALDDEDTDEVDDEDDDKDKDGDEWPYHLGAPTRPPVSDPLICTWGLQLLDAAGFINYEQDDADAYMDPVGRFAKIRNPLNLQSERIHPILRKDMFQNLTDSGYELILPAIMLASAYLDDPTTLNFFYGVWATEQHTSFWDIDLGHCTIVHVPESLSEENQRETYEKILAMRKWTSWVFVDPSQLDKHGALALTGPKLDANSKLIPVSGP